MKGNKRKDAKPYPMYKHIRTIGKRLSECGEFSNVNGALLEQAVMTDIFGLIGDKQKREQILKASNRSVEYAKEVEEMVKQKEKQLLKIEREKENVVRAVRKGLLDDSDIAKQMANLRERERVVKREVEKGKDQLSELVTESDLKKAIDLRPRKRRPTRKSQDGEMRDGWLKSRERFEEMSFDEKRELLSSMFKGKDADGRKYGVYLRRDPKGWQYEIYGDYGSMRGYVLNRSSNPSKKRLDVKMRGLDQDQKLLILRISNQIPLRRAA